MAKCYPVSLNLENRVSLVLGGGAVAERKVLSLLECGASVKVVSRELTPRLHLMAEEGRIAYRRGEYNCSDLKEVFLAIGATDNKEINRRLAVDCRKLNVLVNVADDPDYSSFYVPAVVRRGSFQIAVSTDGKSPLLARKIKEELQEKYGPQYGELTDFLGEIRRRALNEIKDTCLRRVILAGLIDDEVLAMIREGLWRQAKERIMANVHLYSGGQS